MNISNPKTQIFIVAALLIILLGSVVLSVTFRTSSTPTLINNADNTSISSTVSKGNKIQLTSTSQFKLSDKIVSVNNDWQVTDASIGNKFDDILCKEECVIFKVSKGDNFFYISSQLISSGIQTESDSEKDFQVTAEPNIFTLKYYESSIIAPTENSQTEALGEYFHFKRQLFGCIQDGICVSSPNVDLSTTNSSADIDSQTKKLEESFKDFLISLSY